MSDIARHRWTYGLRLLEGQIDRATWRNTLMYRLNRDLQLGVEYNPLAGDVSPLANWRLVRETERRPAVILGTSSDRIGTPEGNQGYYLTFSKDLEPLTGLPVAPYLAVQYSEFDRGINLPLGAAVRLGRDWTLMPTYDGHAFHPMLTYRWRGGKYSLTGILVRGRDPGFAFTVGF
jgi:hypothetical protein